MDHPVRTRVAPSPTGFAHVGTAYAALFNWAFAKKNNGKFVLRLEDSDVDRNVPGAEEAIYSGLSWLGIAWDEGPDRGGKYGPYRISERLDIYQNKARKLIESKKAYEEEGAIKLRSPGKDLSWDDAVHGTITFPADQIKDFVIIKSDGYPTYNFAVVVDDILMRISHVIRGEEHISNTPRQLVVYKALDQSPPCFAHFPTLRNQDHKKLSKRRDPVDLKLYRQQGYLPEALLNFLCLLGWSHPEGKEIFSPDEFVEQFSLGRVRKAGPVFDNQKLDWINGEYIRQKDNKTLAHILGQHISTNTSEDFLEQVVPLIKERVNKLSEAEELIRFFWERHEPGRKMFPDPQSSAYIASASTAISNIKEWSLENLNKELSKVIKEHKFKTGNFYMALRIAITGKRITPPINESVIILGQDKVLKRLDDIQKTLIEI